MWSYPFLTLHHRVGTIVHWRGEKKFFLFRNSFHLWNEQVEWNSHLTLMCASKKFHWFDTLYNPCACNIVVLIGTTWRDWRCVCDGIWKKKTPGRPFLSCAISLNWFVLRKRTLRGEILFCCSCFKSIHCGMPFAVWKILSVHLGIPNGSGWLFILKFIFEKSDWPVFPFQQFFLPFPLSVEEKKEKVPDR